MLTAETITDDQIRELKRILRSEYSDSNHPNFDRALGLFGPGPGLPECADALNDHMTDEHRRRCRAICAMFINTRNASSNRAT